jgi:RNA polymerase sigma-70 factor (ECF subfamily)
VDIDSVDPETLISEEGTGGNPMLSVAALEEGETLRRVVAKLPEKYRACIILFYFNELSYEEISRVMNISLSNTKILLFRGKKMLLETYRKETGGKV